MWYSADLLFESVHETERQVEGLWEEVVVLIDAPGERQAQEIAVQLGYAKEHEYFVDSPERHRVRWTFYGVLRICEIESELRHGSELFSRFLRKAEALSLLKSFD